MYTGSTVFTKADSKFKTTEDCKAKGTKIAVLLGATGEKEAKAAFPDADIKSYKGGGPLLLDAVNNGQADCGVNDVSAVKGQSTAYPGRHASPSCRTCCRRSRLPSPPAMTSRTC